ncbi:CGNR zinc finger domain-containing protein [Marinivivus vitaminiproducens]|uniref:CGNR zinc finger domain-containing protein n=1 Tax=Marinivivus vitaminiproducens TaxID=3035935 RepID=UPI002798E6B6|nr:CGNR zinc finger domain-containing protein [Geminicoccaceae bacterium SCSIO 64248]
MDIVFRPWQAADLVGGTPCLDLVNTAGGRTKARDSERLPDVEAALDWAGLAGLLDDEDAARLHAVAAHDATTAEASLAGLRDFRESLHGFLTARTKGCEPDTDHARRVEAAIKDAVGLARLASAGAPGPWRIDEDRTGLDIVRHRAALDALRLIGSAELALLRACERCSWLFLDRSRNGKRRWCQPSTCGNRARAQRHYRRRTAAPADP